VPQGPYSPPAPAQLAALVAWPSLTASRRPRGQSGRHRPSPGRRLALHPPLNAGQRAGERRARPGRHSRCPRWSRFRRASCLGAPPAGRDLEVRDRVAKGPRHLGPHSRRGKPFAILRPQMPRESAQPSVACPKLSRAISERGRGAAGPEATSRDAAPLTPLESGPSSVAIASHRRIDPHLRRAPGAMRGHEAAVARSGPCRSPAGPRNARDARQFSTARDPTGGGLLAASSRRPLSLAGVGRVPATA
jgi:hypothetical protein